MKLKTFKRGVHPYGGKDIAKDCAVKSLEGQDIMVYPLRQCIGAPSKAVVKKGDRVLKGQLIAEAGGFVGAPIFSSVSGTVKTIENRRVINGDKVMSIVIENDHLDETADNFGKDRELSSMTGEDVIEEVKNAGIVGLGGAGFPTYVKLAAKNRLDIDYFIVNGAECEPYLTSDYRLMIEKPAQILYGIQAVLKALPKARAVIAIENNKPQAIEAMTQVSRADDRIDVCPLKTKYPQGGERQLIYAVTKRKISSKMLPADKGCIVDNIGTIFAIYEAVYKNMPLVHKLMTVTGDGVNQGANFDVPFGVSHSYVLEQAGGAKPGAKKVISGGPMMGIAMSSLDVPVVKTSSSVLVFEKDEVADAKQTNCIHCGRCINACPESLVPQLMGQAMKHNNVEQFEKLNGAECIECGSCAYVCPAKIPLTQMFKLGKIKIRENKAAAK